MWVPLFLLTGTAGAWYLLFIDYKRWSMDIIAGVECSIMKYPDVAVVILAAGKGSRMKSDKPKVLHTVKEKPLIQWVLECADQVTGHIVVVVGHLAEQVKACVSEVISTGFAIQKELLGTGDAVKTALPLLSKDISDVVILCGDVPLIRSKTVDSLVCAHRDNANDVTVLAVEMDDPTGYGRVLLDVRGEVSVIREEVDATDAEKQIRLINSGIYCVCRNFLDKAIGCLGQNNAQGEYYLTDIIGLARQWRCRVGLMVGNSAYEVAGINTIEQLLEVETLMNEIDV